MDQLKPILAAIKVHRFWIISGIVLIGFMSTWYLETNRLRKETQAQQSKIDQAFQAVSSVSSTPLHPNPNTHVGMDSLHARYYAELQAAWSEQYDAQKDSLVWHGMTDEFVSDVEKLKPIESKVGAELTELEEPLTSDQRNQYRFFIGNELPRLADIVGAHWAPAGKLPPGKTEIVTWNPGNQNNILNTRFSWQNSIPTTLEVLYAQEDMWILTAMLEVIRNVNGNVRGKYEAPIKEIDFLEFGADAVGLAGTIESLEAAVRSSGGGEGGGEMGGEMMGMGMGMEMGNSGSDNGGGGSGDAAVSNDPAENRYLDKDFKPLSAKRLREAYDSEKPEDAIYAVAKRIPIRMRLTMDQRKISRLLAECANYKMQIEVRQVRINCPSGSTFRGRPGSGGGMGGMGGEGSGEMDGGAMGGFGGGDGMEGGGFGDEGSDGDERMMGGGIGNQETLNLKDSSPWDVTVEIYGIILFYNPVAISKIESKLNLPETVTPGTPVPTEAG